jgi:hypothetical protein
MGIAVRRAGGAGLRCQRDSLLVRAAGAGRVAARSRRGDRRPPGQSPAARLAARRLSLRSTTCLQRRRRDRGGEDARRPRFPPRRRLRPAAPHRSQLRALPLPAPRALVRRHLRRDLTAAPAPGRGKPAAGLPAHLGPGLRRLRLRLSQALNGAGRGGPWRPAGVRRPSRAGRPGPRHLRQRRMRRQAIRRTCRSG